MLYPKNITHNQSSITLYPERGGIITSMKVHNTELLYLGMLDETLYDRSKSVRGGIPILFPNAGFLTDEQKVKTGWSLPQHGFARTNIWRIVDESAYSLTQSLSSSDVPDMFGYMWQGNIQNTISLSDESIELKYSITNESDRELPISWGFHPYWNIPLGDKSQIQWNFPGGDIIARDIDNWSHGGTTRINTPDDGIVRFMIPGVGTIELHLFPEFRRLWVWSLEGRDFVCVEPVMGDDGDIVRDPMRIQARGKNDYSLKILLVIQR